MQGLFHSEATTTSFLWPAVKDLQKIALQLDMKKTCLRWGIGFLSFYER